MTLPSQELLDWWKPKLHALDPFREVGLDEIDALYSERPKALYRSLTTKLVSAKDPAGFKVLLCGSRGSGKSTEITRFVHEVSQRYCVVQTDIGAGLSATSGTLAVVTLLGVAALHAIRMWSAPDADVEALVAERRATPLTRGIDRLQAAFDRFGGSLPSVTKILESVGGVVSLLDAPTGVALATVAKSSASASDAGSKLRNALARGPLGDRLSPEHSNDASAVVEAVNEILAELEALARRPPLLVADGLDKRTVVEEVQLALGDEHLLRALRAPLIVSGPVNLRHDPRFRAVPGNFQLALLYNVPICEHAPDGRVVPSKIGVEMLCDLYERRRRAAGIPTTTLAPELVELAAQQCAGIVREFLGLLHSACMLALEKGHRDANASDLADAIKSRRLELEGYLDEGDLTILRRVLEKEVVPAGSEADVLLFENFIACYPNEHVWFRPHELIVEYVRARASDG